MMDRDTAIAALAAEHFDLAVIGGGITGAGVALDAASRGLAVALLERHDYACGSSSRTTKLVHGGLHHLRGMHLRQVREELGERELMLELAPRLVRRLPVVLPSSGGARALGAALAAYDLLALGAPGRGVRHRRLSAADVAELVPALAPGGLTSAYLYYDCQADDVRLVLDVLAEAARRGAVCANRTEAVEVLERGGRVAGVEARDLERGGRLTISADRVVNAAGAWAARLTRDVAPPPSQSSRGTHILLSAADVSLNGAGVLLPASGTRHVCALPWLGRVLVGATDDDHRGELDEARPLAADVDYLLAAVNSFFGRALSPTDVAGAFAGVQPGRAADRASALDVTSAGTVTVTGGTLTTWRRMAQHAVDRVVEQDGRRAPCRTQEIVFAPRADGRSLRWPDGITTEVREHLASRYGPAANEVLALAGAHPQHALPIVEGWPDLLAEAVYAARHEQARSVGDVLLRRTRLGLLAARAASDPHGDVPQRVARALARELGWGDCRIRQEADAWLREAQNEGLVPAPDSRSWT